MFFLNVNTFLNNLFSKYLLNPYIPKDATQQSLFLSKYPSFDGRGIKIAIIDSGIDVSFEGLQKTSEGLPKIVDYFDFTGAGDVDTSIIKEADSKNYLIGLSGRKLKIPKEWINPSGEWHLGLKALYKPSMSPAKVPEKLPELDCIVWFNGEKWCVCIETYKTDLKKAKILTNFRDDHEYGILILNKIKMAYCITVHNDGNLLEIFTPYDYHGSVVAQIAVAHFPEKPEYSGLAPGAQIVSMSVVGPEDGFLLYPEKMERVTKALLKCIEMKVDIINCSLPSFYGNEEIGNLINEMYNKYNILLFKSAGNNGPFYTSVGKIDSNVEDSVFKIGALLTSEMKRRIYYAQINITNPPLPIVYASSSRGPGDNGSWGLDFVAPGAAVSYVPRFTSERKKCFDGTSYSTPNAGGAVACLLSALKANSIPYSPALIKFALFKTAFLPINGNIFEFGHGIIEIDSAFDYYCKNVINFKSVAIRFKNRTGGITFTNLDEHPQSVMERSINLSDFINIENDTVEKWEFQISQSAEKFIEISEINENNNFFTVKVDTNNLEAGSFNFGKILVLHPLIGSIFNIPINVVYPLRITETENFHIQKEITLNYENPFHFIFYPFFESSKKIMCDVQITALEKLRTNICIQNVEYNNRFQSIQDGDPKKVLKFLSINQIESYSFALEKSEIQEVCIYSTMVYRMPLAAKFRIEFSFKN